jgi:uncharacterized protein
MDPAHQVLQQRDEILRICARHGVKRVQLFGSTVRGEAGLDSDIDFLVERSGARTPWWPGGLVAELTYLLGRKVDIVTRESLHPLVREYVLRELRPL